MKRFQETSQRDAVVSFMKTMQGIGSALVYRLRAVTAGRGAGRLQWLRFSAGYSGLRAGEGQYEYRFRADLFRLWVRQAHSVWE